MIPIQTRDKTEWVSGKTIGVCEVCELTEAVIEIDGRLLCQFDVPKDPPLPVFTQLKQGYPCSNCDRLHNYESDALSCCPEEIGEVWLCPNCEQICFSEADALKCCEGKYIWRPEGE